MTTSPAASPREPHRFVLQRRVLQDTEQRQRLRREQDEGASRQQWVAAFQQGPRGATLKHSSAAGLHAALQSKSKPETGTASSSSLSVASGSVAAARAAASRTTTPNAEKRRSGAGGLSRTREADLNILNNTEDTTTALAVLKDVAVAAMEGGKGRPAGPHARHSPPSGGRVLRTPTPARKAVVEEEPNPLESSTTRPCPLPGGRDTSPRLAPHLTSTHSAAERAPGGGASSGLSVLSLHQANTALQQQLRLLQHQLEETQSQLSSEKHARTAQQQEYEAAMEVHKRTQKEQQQQLRDQQFAVERLQQRELRRSATPSPAPVRLSNQSTTTPLRSSHTTSSTTTTTAPLSHNSEEVLERYQREAEEKEEQLAALQEQLRRAQDERASDRKELHEAAERKQAALEAALAEQARLEELTRQQRESYEALVQSWEEKYRQAITPPPLLLRAKRSPKVTFQLDSEEAAYQLKCDLRQMRKEYEMMEWHTVWLEKEANTLREKMRQHEFGHASSGEGHAPSPNKSTASSAAVMEEPHDGLRQTAEASLKEPCCSASQKMRDLEREVQRLQQALEAAELRGKETETMLETTTTKVEKLLRVLREKESELADCKQGAAKLREDVETERAKQEQEWKSCTSTHRMELRRVRREVEKECQEKHQAAVQELEAAHRHAVEEATCSASASASVARIHKEAAEATQGKLRAKERDMEEKTRALEALREEANQHAEALAELAEAQAEWVEEKLRLQAALEEEVHKGATRTQSLKADWTRELEEATAKHQAVEKALREELETERRCATQKREEVYAALDLQRVQEVEAEVQQRREVEQRLQEALQQLQTEQQSEAATHAERSRTLEQRAIQAEVQCESLQHDVSTLQQLNHTLREEQQGALQALEQKYQALLTEITQRHAAAEGAANSQESTIFTLQQQVLQLESTKTTLESQVAECETRSAQLKAQMEMALAQAEAAVSSSETTYHTRVQQLELDLKALEKRNNELQEQLQAANATVVAAEARAKAAETRSTAERQAQRVGDAAQVDALSAQNRELEEALCTVEAQMVALTTEVEAVRAENTDALSQLERLRTTTNAELNLLRRTLKTKEAQAAQTEELEEAVCLLQKQVETSETKIKTLETRLHARNTAAAAAQLIALSPTTSRAASPTTTTPALFDASALRRRAVSPVPSVLGAQQPMLSPARREVDGITEATPLFSEDEDDALSQDQLQVARRVALSATLKGVSTGTAASTSTAATMTLAHQTTTATTMTDPQVKQSHSETIVVLTPRQRPVSPSMSPSRSTAARRARSPTSPHRLDTRFFDPTVIVSASPQPPAAAGSGVQNMNHSCSSLTLASAPGLWSGGLSPTSCTSYSTNPQHSMHHTHAGHSSAGHSTPLPQAVSAQLYNSPEDLTFQQFSSRYLLLGKNGKRLERPYTVANPSSPASPSALSSSSSTRPAQRFLGRSTMTSNMNKDKNGQNNNSNSNSAASASALGSVSHVVWASRFQDSGMFHRTSSGSLYGNLMIPTNTTEPMVFVFTVRVSWLPTEGCDNVFQRTPSSPRGASLHDPALGPGSSSFTTASRINREVLIGFAERGLQLERYASTTTTSARPPSQKNSTAPGFVFYNGKWCTAEEVAQCKGGSAEAPPPAEGDEAAQLQERMAAEWNSRRTFQPLHRDVACYYYNIQNRRLYAPVQHVLCTPLKSNTPPPVSNSASTQNQSSSSLSVPVGSTVVQCALHYRESCITYTVLEEQLASPTIRRWVEVSRDVVGFRRVDLTKPLYPAVEVNDHGAVVELI